MIPRHQHVNYIWNDLEISEISASYCCRTILTDLCINEKYIISGETPLFQINKTFHINFSIKSCDVDIPDQFTLSTLSSDK